jgi:pimeloyl-ACP methyl ester carboxylesterase
VRGTVSRLPGLVLTDHEVEVPLDHAVPDGERITVFAREVVAPRKRDQDLPWLVFLQGGPGARSPRPANRSGWLGRALADHRVLLLDQRGTGRSTPATRQTLTARGGPAEQARYLRHFRADSIVRDAEIVREALLGAGRRWSLLGQSYGGFVALTYLSLAPQSLDKVLVAGGLPPLDRGPDDVYRATFERVRQRNDRLSTRYPADAGRLDAVADHLAAHDVQLPSGDLLTVARLQSLGLGLGYSDGLEKLHYLLETAWAGADPDALSDELSDEFLAAVEAATTFVDRPLYAVMHESIYCQGEASRWSAQRVADGLPEFSPAARPLLLTGEMVLPGLVRGDRAVAPLAEAADLLSSYDDWPALYDLGVLAANEVPVAAVVYHEDMYVERAFSADTAERVGNLRWWSTGDLGHDGLRNDANVLDRLLDLAGAPGVSGPAAVERIGG